jgi:hypothetical protein
VDSPTQLAQSIQTLLFTIRSDATHLDSQRCEPSDELTETRCSIASDRNVTHRKACFHYGSSPDDARHTFQAILKIFAIGVGCAIWLKSMSHAHRDNDHRGNSPENGIGRKF